MKRGPRSGLRRRPQVLAFALSLALALVATLSGRSFAAEPQASTPPCPDPGSEPLLIGSLPRLAARIAQTRTLKIVALGSSSTGGAGASSVDGNYPKQLERALRRRLVGYDVNVLNAGVNGNSVLDMLERMDHDALDLKPDLVIWQFGANDLLNRLSPQLLREAARTGIARIRASGADAMVMDLQRAPRIDAMPARDEVLRIIDEVARDGGAARFHRYRLMSAWAGALGEDYRQMLRADQLHMNDLSYRCMAQVLADAMLQADGR